MKRISFNISRQFLLLILIFPVCLFSQETEVMVRVQSKDAKFIGTSLGGARIIIKDAETGKILAEGITRGSTGDTERIMNTPLTRGNRLTDENTAGFLAKLDISKPVFVTIEAIGPVSKKQAAVKSTTQQWILPGKHIKGEGIILEIPGFVVDILSPQTHESIGANTEIEITANVVMMCGCPVTDGGLWNANDYEVKALITKEGTEETEIALKVLAKPSTFKGTTNLSPGNYEITVYAFDPVTGNTGLDKTNIIIQ
ncbi:MAG: hypothetical protein ABJ092_09070 [Gillisia sp.]